MREGHFTDKTCDCLTKATHKMAWYVTYDVIMMRDGHTNTRNNLRKDYKCEFERALLPTKLLYAFQTLLMMRDGHTNV
jgi:hypothetical protein